MTRRAQHSGRYFQGMRLVVWYIWPECRMDYEAALGSG